MIPIYALVSWLSFWQYKHTIYYQVLRDCYEAFAIAAFFTLMCNYCAPNIHEQKEYFRHQRPKKWVLPLNWIQRCTGGPSRGILRTPSSGLTWFNIMWIGIFQYCFIRIFFTFVALATQATGRYCESSLNPAFSHVWVQAFDAAAVTVAMYCIIQFYFQIKQDIQEHRPVLKLLAIKLVIFFSFWQNVSPQMASVWTGTNSLLQFLIGFASTHVEPTPHIAYMDVKVGIPSMLLCVEMAIFSVLHLWAFPWKAYSLKDTDPLNAPGSGYSGKPHYEGGPLGIKAFAHAGNPWDVIKSSARGFRWLFIGVKHRREDTSYKSGGGWDTDNGVLGAHGEGEAGAYYSSTKLGPVRQGGPTSMQRDRHMSAERIDDVNRRQSAERRVESANGSSTFVASSGVSSVNGGWPGHSTGDLADVPPQSYDTSYRGASNGGRSAYYGGELPPAPYPMYPAGGTSFLPNPYDGGSSANARDASPFRGAEEHDTAGLLSNAGAIGGTSPRLDTRGQEESRR